MAWMAGIVSPDAGYAGFVLPFIVSAVAMSMFWAPVANVVLGSVRSDQEGQASGANNAIRELGGVFGVAVLASVFARYGGYDTGQTFVDGMAPAMWIGAGRARARPRKRSAGRRASEGAARAAPSAFSGSA